MGREKKGTGPGLRSERILRKKSGVAVRGGATGTAEIGSKESSTLIGHCRQRAQSESMLEVKQNRGGLPRSVKARIKIPSTKIAKIEAGGNGAALRLAWNGGSMSATQYAG